jgi:cellobiose phosphorylase
VGEHGLIKSWHGDWNDYLFPMGQAGKGESMKNTGMACRAGIHLSRIARLKGENECADTIDAYVKKLQQAASKAWTGTHFIRGYTDAGKPVGGKDRVFINAQSWAALGKCGTEEQRYQALQHALQHNDTPLGLALVNPPFPSPPPSDVSSLPIPQGEGENGGVWPQTIGWFIWALSEENLSAEAKLLWNRMTLRHHYATYPDVPFGIWNGPDCYNSHLAGERAHWTQVQLWDRRVHTPMNPSVGWQAFGRYRIQKGEG